MGLDSNRKTTSSTYYFEFGDNEQISGNISTDRHRANTKVEDESNLLNEGKRFRHLDLGIFLTPDPLEYTDGLNPYIYCSQNPWTRYDPDGLFWDTIWDVANIIYDTGAAIYNHVVGDHKTAKSHWVDAGYDTAAALIPGVPAGLSKIKNAGKALDKAKDATKGAEKVADNVKKAEKTSDNAKSSKEVAEKANKREKTYQTYTKKNEETGEVYSGRTSGTDTPKKNVENRDHNHHKNKDGFGPAELDKTSSNPDAIRGREQDLINKHGGAKSQGGTSGNAINGISKNNPKAQKYMDVAKKEFGDK